MGALLLFSVNELYYVALTSPKGSGKLCFKMDFCWGRNSNIFWCSHRRIRLCSQTWSPHFYCLAKNDNKDLPCLRVRFHIHLNWCLAGCTEWRWIWSHLLEVLDRRSGRERRALFWRTSLENHLSKFCISKEKAACHLLCTSNQAQGWIWSASMLYSWCKAYSSSWYLLDKLKKKGKEVFIIGFELYIVPKGF